MQHPNVVLIIADDLGWRDLGCCGSSFYETPNLDQLAQEGTRFTDAYAAAPVCSPTRASLMTGRTPAAVGITNYIAGRAEGRLVEPSYRHALPADEHTIANALGELGFQTTYVGKWHLGGREHEALPTDHGFDENVAGCSWGSPVHGYFAPWGIPTLDESDVEEGAYLPDHLGRAAANAVTERDDPFFLCYAPYLVHTPLQAPKDDVERYERKRRSLGLDAIDTLEVGGTFPCAHKQDRRIKRRTVQSHPTYAAMVEAFDRNVGRVLDALDAEGIADETIVIVTSDNGGLATAEGSPTTNRPLREGKGWMDEGGNRVPLLVRWPGVTDRSDAPGLIETPAISYDLFPTIIRAAGGEPDADAIAGVDLAPALRGEAMDRPPLVWHYPHYGNQGGTPSGAIRDGPWKLIEYYETDSVRLHHLDDDVREQTDLSDYRPQKANELRARLHEWREHVDADMPEQNPTFEPWEDRAGPPSPRG